ncbi:hypothetical protein NUW54_g1982 [Trametes sanguinea]|uniref:Uncharacterized protein n=1 Tax=Trametes sanguinea TaxID=158606 RepID=A0ACC1Q535_9APHY|nr:hypothetical protein NUW54_g1982 [Trametes sanguinea]
MPTGAECFGPRRVSSPYACPCSASALTIVVASPSRIVEVPLHSKPNPDTATGSLGDAGEGGNTATLTVSYVTLHASSTSELVHRRSPPPPRAQYSHGLRCASTTLSSSSPTTGLGDTPAAYVIDPFDRQHIGQSAHGTGMGYFPAACSPRFAKAGYCGVRFPETLPNKATGNHRAGRSQGGEVIVAMMLAAQLAGTEADEVVQPKDVSAIVIVMNPVALIFSVAGGSLSGEHHGSPVFRLAVRGDSPSSTSLFACVCPPGKNT